MPVAMSCVVLHLFLTLYLDHPVHSSNNIRKRLKAQQSTHNSGIIHMLFAGSTESFFVHFRAETAIMIMLKDVQKYCFFLYLVKILQFSCAFAYSDNCDRKDKKCTKHYKNTCRDVGSELDRHILHQR